VTNNVDNGLLMSRGCHMQSTVWQTVWYTVFCGHWYPSVRHSNSRYVLQIPSTSFCFSRLFCYSRWPLGSFGSHVFFLGACY